MDYCLNQRFDERRAETRTKRYECETEAPTRKLSRYLAERAAVGLRNVSSSYTIIGAAPAEQTPPGWSSSYLSTNPSAQPRPAPALSTIAHHVKNSINRFNRCARPQGSVHTYAAERDKRFAAILTSRHTQDAETRVLFLGFRSV